MAPPGTVRARVPGAHNRKGTTIEVEQQRIHYNTVRPHSRLICQPAGVGCIDPKTETD